MFSSTTFSVWIAKYKPHWKNGVWPYIKLPIASDISEMNTSMLGTVQKCIG